MGNEHKKRVEAALHKYYEKENKKASGPTRRNEKPEKEVEKACMALMRSWGWSVQIIESKSTFDPNRQRYIAQSTKAGTLDCMGNTESGIAAAVEFKAPGRLSTLRYNQRKTLVDKINTNGFACVTDSAERLKAIYEKWRELRANNTDFSVSRNYLLSMLPQEKTRLEDEPLFADE